MSAAAPKQKRKPGEQPFRYPLERSYMEPDWTRLPSYRGVSRTDWESALWQRKNTVKNLAERLLETGGAKGRALR